MCMAIPFGALHAAHRYAVILGGSFNVFRCFRRTDSGEAFPGPIGQVLRLKDANKILPVKLGFLAVLQECPKHLLPPRMGGTAEPAFCQKQLILRRLKRILQDSWLQHGHLIGIVLLTRLFQTGSGNC